ncbi:C-C motif chemokine 28-like [Xenopus laevis]|uniref:Chemokine interleukin-8-like domain-containing protein n=2 Tax=Xenopus laevis TaxID=8355 RepID=A0A974E3R5_XENLA|nr:C-C motif chemokine 28-like [Xenopus laevis]OCU02761.1 hypothetical protein XELAEV_18008530mg [Xenopus laevis]
MRLVILVLILCATLYCTDGLPTNFAHCCTEVARRIPQNLLPRVTGVQIQKSDGICNIRAVVLQVNNKKICMDPKNRSLQKWMKKRHPKKNVVRASHYPSV